jgi:hypothetical protein
MLCPPSSPPSSPLPSAAYAPLTAIVQARVPSVPSPTPLTAPLPGDVMEVQCWRPRPRLPPLRPRLRRAPRLGRGGVGPSTPQRPSVVLPVAGPRRGPHPTVVLPPPHTQAGRHRQTQQPPRGEPQAQAGHQATAHGRAVPRRRLCAPRRRPGSRHLRHRSLAQRVPRPQRHGVRRLR